MSNLDIIRGRSTVLNLTNQTGAARTTGDVVAISTANDESFITSTTSNYAATRLGIVDESIGIGSNGRVVIEGYARNVNVLSSAARGDYMYQSTTAAKAAPGAAIAQGAFGQFLKGGTGTTPSAVVRDIVLSGAAAPTISAGSNSTDVAEVGSAGASSALWSPFDHRHSGVLEITASSSNVLQRGRVNFRPGTGIALNLTNTDGDAEFDTITIQATTAAGGGGGGATAALVLLGSTTLGADASTISVASIPQTYKDLVVVAQLRGTFSGEVLDHFLRVGNGSVDTGGNYAENTIYRGSGSGTSGGNSQTRLYMGILTGATANSGVFSSVVVEITNYTSATSHRYVKGWSIHADTAFYTADIAGSWKNRASAIDIVQFHPDSLNFLTGSKVFVYGRG